MIKRIYSFVTLICLTASLSAVNYTISFSGSGSATNVEGVTVTNLKTAQVTTVPAGGSLLLIMLATDLEENNSSDGQLHLFTNPSSSYVTAEYYSDRAGDAQIEVLDMLGNRLAVLNQQLSEGSNTFKICGMASGIYMVNLKAFGKCSAVKTVGRADGNNNITINYQGVQNIKRSYSKNQLKATGQLTYTPGDWLMFQGKSGIYSTVVTDDPTSSKTIDFNFIACTDGDNNNYPVVKIGAQTWMARNLATTKYNDGTTAIPNISGSSNTTWTQTITPAYCWYNGDAGVYNKTTNGALYNGYAVTTSKNVCPIGWHVPTDTEWTTLANTLGGNSVAGGKLKDTNTGINVWADPNEGANNQSGFTAPPAGYRDYYYGSFDKKGDGTIFWSATNDPNNTIQQWSRSLGFTTAFISRISSDKKSGYSVRCVKD